MLWCSCLVTYVLKGRGERRPSSNSKKVEKQKVTCFCVAESIRPLSRKFGSSENPRGVPLSMQDLTKKHPADSLFAKYCIVGRGRGSEGGECPGVVKTSLPMGDAKKKKAPPPALPRPPPAPKPAAQKPAEAHKPAKEAKVCRRCCMPVTSLHLFPEGSTVRWLMMGLPSRLSRAPQARQSSSIWRRCERLRLRMSSCWRAQASNDQQQQQ